MVLSFIVEILYSVFEENSVHPDQMPHSELLGLHNSGSTLFVNVPYMGY